MLFGKTKFSDLFYPYRIFTVLAVFFLGGILLASFLNLNFLYSWPIYLLSSISFLFVSFLFLCYKDKILLLLSLGLIAMLLGLGYYSFFDQRISILPPYNEKNEYVGKVVKRPEIDYKKQKLVLEYRLSNGKKTYLLVNAPTFPEYRYGDILKVEGKIQEPENFGDFDYKSYLKRYFIFGIVNTPRITYLEKSDSLNDQFIKVLYFVSASFEQALNRILPEPHASLASGILLGVKRNIPDSVMDNLNKAGLTHIVALSGYNVAIIISILCTLLAGCVGRRRTFYLGTILVVVFVLLTGASSSVVRAAIFSLLLLFGGTIGRRADQTNLMLLAAFVMVLANPFVLRFDLGFQLSFLAFAGLIYLSSGLYKKIDKMKFKLPEGIKRPLSETLGAQIMVFPLIWWQFGRLSLIAPITNIIVLPVIPIGMGLIFAAGTTAIIYYPLGKIAGFILWPMLQYLIKVAELSAKIPFSSLGQ